MYSPFRRIGRPRKSTTNARSTDTTTTKTAKSRAKNASTHEVDLTPANGNLPNVDVDPVPAPPSSPASTENGFENCGGPWYYPWSADGSSLYSGVQSSLENPVNVLDGIDSYPSTTDCLDMGAYFDASHNLIMDSSTRPGTSSSVLDMGQPMQQPTPPSTSNLDTTTFGEAFPHNPNNSGFGPMLSQTSQHQRNASVTSTLNNSVSGLALGSAYPDLAAMNTAQNTGICGRPPLQLSTANNPTCGPSPELTPPLSAQSPLSQGPCSNRCSSSLIRQLAVLNQHLSENSNPSLDTVLQTEKDAYALCKTVLGCSACIENKSSYLLFSMVVEQIMRLLETIPDEGASETCALLVGNFEVDRDTKATFVKRYLLLRLHKFANMLKEFAGTIDQDANDYNSNAAKEMVSDVYQRLDLLRRVIGLWE